jgi:hypothetical protein
MSSTPIEADKLKSLAFLFEFTKRTLLMKKQLNLLTPDQVSNVQTIVGDLENKKKTMVFRVLNITDNNKDLKAVVQQKVDKSIKLTYKQKHLNLLN